MAGLFALTLLIIRSNHNPKGVNPVV
jgi:hypothetical protein